MTSFSTRHIPGAGLRHFYHMIDPRKLLVSDSELAEAKRLLVRGPGFTIVYWDHSISNVHMRQLDNNKRRKLDLTMDLTELKFGS